MWWEDKNRCKFSSEFALYFRKRLMPVSLQLFYLDTQIFWSVLSSLSFLREPSFTKLFIPGEDQGCIEIANGHDILLTAPKTSHNYKNFLRGTSKASHKYTFSKITNPAVKQREFFEETTLQTVQDFVNGQNCLVFTYGVTNSGKTYTIQGSLEGGNWLVKWRLDLLTNYQKNSVEGPSLWSALLDFNFKLFRNSYGSWNSASEFGCIIQQRGGAVGRIGSVSAQHVQQRP